MYSSDGPPTHLMLDGGKATVPDEAHAEFLSAYAASLVAQPRRPCVSEVRTPLFRMFVDADARFDTEDGAEAAMDGWDAPGVEDEYEVGAPGGDGCENDDSPRAPTPSSSSPSPTTFRAAVRALCGVVGADRRALVLVASAPKAAGDGTWKRGVHVVWPEVVVATDTALALRDRMLECVRGSSIPGLAGDWESTLDAAVYTSSGLRMPWSAKGRGEDSPRWYVPSHAFADGEFEPVRPPQTFSEYRALLVDCVVRAPGAPRPTLELVTPRAPSSNGGGVTGTSGSLGPFADVLDDLAACLPAEFAGQRFVGVFSTDTAYMLRSSSRFCLNLGREHRSSNVYFLLTRRGVCQRCYCRKDTEEGRAAGTCKEFSSPTWTVPPAVLDRFFGGGDDDLTPPSGTSSGAAAGAAAVVGGPAPVGATAAAVAPMPSRAAARGFWNLDTLAAMSRPEVGPKRRRRGG